MYQKILVPLDGSDLVEVALPHAESLALKYGAELILPQVAGPLYNGATIHKFDGI